MRKHKEQTKSTELELRGWCYEPTTLHNQERLYTFVYAKEAPQQEVYSACAAEMVDAVIEGTNACIFAFGSTGAGKTHSMLGPEGGRRQAKQDGILPRAAAELFRRIARSEAEAKAAIGAGGFSAYEVRAA